MPSIRIPLDETDVVTASRRLDSEIERLETAQKRIAVIRYPPRLASELGIAQGHNSAIYRKHRASAHNVVPYEIIIEYEV